MYNAVGLLKKFNYNKEDSNKQRKNPYTPHLQKLQTKSTKIKNDYFLYIAIISILIIHIV
jgi:hypothetical protein